MEAVFTKAAVRRGVKEQGPEDVVYVSYETGIAGSGDDGWDEHLVDAGDDGWLDDDVHFDS